MSAAGCPECAKVSGGCAAHNGSGVYVVQPNGQLQQTHDYVARKTPLGFELVLQRLIPDWARK